MSSSYPIRTDQFTPCDLSTKTVARNDFFSWRCLLLFCCLLEHRNTFLQTHVPKMDEESFVILQNEDSVQNWAVEFKFGEDIIYVPVSTETMERLKTGMLKLVLSFSVCV